MILLVTASTLRQVSGLLDSTTWMEMVARARPNAAWLQESGPDRDVILSTRYRAARNLKGFTFPCSADRTAKMEVVAKVATVLPTALPGWSIEDSCAPIEIDLLVADRLISHEFHPSDSTQAICLAPKRIGSMMVNEEDHIRLQVLLPGWQPDESRVQGQKGERSLARVLDFAYAEPWGFLTASPFNTGQGVRLSAMVHLIGLARTKRWEGVSKALVSQGVVVRGLFGENTRGVGALFQVSTQRGVSADFVGACEYLLREEREARSTVDPEVVHKLTQEVIRFAVTSRSLSYTDCVRVLGYVRWAAGLSIPIYQVELAQIDRWISALDFRSKPGDDSRGIRRASLMRTNLEPMLDRRS
ncbi:MAG: hypothetical protein JST40_11190 [Armatimonadetes bacterium]|nr:hypothetical protein [Armatimonadota bacterium]